MICATTATVGIPDLRKKAADPELVLPSSSFRIRSLTVYFNSVADPYHFDADPDPVCHHDADPDPSFQIKTQRNLEKVLK
jgi:hypothetical protein